MVMGLVMMVMTMIMVMMMVIVVVVVDDTNAGGDSHNVLHDLNS